MSKIGKLLEKKTKINEDVEKDYYNFAYDYIKKLNHKPGDALFLGSLVYNIEDKFNKEYVKNNYVDSMDFYNSPVYKKSIKIIKKAFIDLYGKDEFEDLVNKNKKTR